MNEKPPASGNLPDPATPANQRPPIYEKPVLRRYDQIEQVRPYGPSEV